MTDAKKIAPELPPLPRPSKYRREQVCNGGYRLVPAYTEAEMQRYARAAIAKATGELK